MIPFISSLKQGKGISVLEATTGSKKGIVREGARLGSSGVFWGTGNVLFFDVGGGCVGDFQFGAVVVCAHFFWADTQRGIAVSGGAFFTFWGATSCLHRSDVCREVLGPAAPTCGSSPRCWVSGGDARAWAPHARSHWSVGLSSVGVHALHFLPALSK